MFSKNKTIAVVFTAVLIAGGVPAVAIAQASSIPQESFRLNTKSVIDLHDQVLAGSTVYPGSSYRGYNKKGYETDGWKQSAFMKDGKVVIEMTGCYLDDAYWSLDELNVLKPDVVIIYDFSSNTKWELEGNWIVESNQFMIEDGTLTAAKVSCIKTGTLGTNSSMACICLVSVVDNKISFQPVRTFDSDETVNMNVPLVIGNNVTCLPDYWAASIARNYQKIVFEEGSQLTNVGDACGGDNAGILSEIEGLPSSAKLNDSALGIPTLKKVTDESGKEIKADNKVWVYQPDKDKAGTLPPAAPDYWKQQLKKAKNISLSVKAKKGGKSAFAKVENVAYKKSKMTVLKGSKYKKVAKAQVAKVTVSKAGKVTVKKGLKKGTYKVSVKAACKGHYKTVTATVKVK